MSFTKNYRPYIKTCHQGKVFGFDIKAVSNLEPLLCFLYKKWWQVDMKGLDKLPKSGPALIVGNNGGILPWAALMLMQALMASRTHPRRLYILSELDWIADESMRAALLSIGFVPWSADNAKLLFAKGEIAIIFPEGIAGAVKHFSYRNRVCDFDWTRILPAIEEHIPIFPLATLGPDEAAPVLANLTGLARFLDLPAFPVTPSLPWYSFPYNFVPFPGKWKMRLLKHEDYTWKETRDDLEETASKHARFIEGEIQAEINRAIRSRIKPLF